MYEGDCLISSFYIKPQRKAYSTHDDNLVGYWEDKEGYHLDYDMWGQPVFNGIDDFAIIETDKIQG